MSLGFPSLHASVGHSVYPQERKDVGSTLKDVYPQERKDVGSTMSFNVYPE